MLQALTVLRELLQSSKYLAVGKKHFSCDLLQNAVVQTVLKVFCFLKKSEHASREMELF